MSRPVSAGRGIAASWVLTVTSSSAMERSGPTSLCRNLLQKVWVMLSAANEAMAKINGLTNRSSMAVRMGGTYVYIGCYDGYTDSSTYFFEAVR